ncbi:MAG: hypothetical protein Q8N26_24555 [Myxococcales bacterium]|nr:hypothetical protein [Myxococcales bacterium]
MSKGVFGQHADDQRWVFIAWEPVPGPRWRAVLAVLLGLVAGTLVGAVTTGSTRVILSLATMVFVTLPMWPRSSLPVAPTLGQFDAMRRAGTLALTTFKTTRPEVIRASWYIAQASPDGSFVIALSGQTESSKHYRPDVFATANVSLDDTVLLGPPRQPAATVYVQGWQRDVVQRENERS